jgi:hypothetical protein
MRHARARAADVAAMLEPLAELGIEKSNSQ